MFRPIKRCVKTTSTICRKIVVPGDPLYDESLVDFSKGWMKHEASKYSCESVSLEKTTPEFEDLQARLAEFEDTAQKWFLVQGIYPIKVIMRLQNEMAEHFCDKRKDHIIETLLVSEDSEDILDQLPEHYTDFVEILNVPSSIKTKAKKSTVPSVTDRLQESGIVGVGKHPKPEVIGFLRSEFIKENGGKLPCENIRVIVEVLRHFDNAKNVIDVCAINGVHSLYTTEVTLDSLLHANSLFLCNNIKIF